jgi:hypothetical protein
MFTRKQHQLARDAIWRGAQRRDSDPWMCTRVSI